MERNRGTTIAIVAALVVAVVSLGVAFAAFSTTLNISGTATVQSSSWKIFFANASNGNDPGTESGVAITGTTTNTAGFSPTASSTSGTLKTAQFTWAGTLKTPGDRLTYTFYIRNTGSYTAKVSSINTPTLTCTKNSSAETTICNNRITYGVYTSSTPSEANRLSTSNTIASGSYQQVWVIIEFDKNTPASELPNSPITVNPSTISITYQQQ